MFESHSTNGDQLYSQRLVMNNFSFGFLMLVFWGGFSRKLLHVLGVLLFQRQTRGATTGLQEVAHHFQHFCGSRNCFRALLCCVVSA